MKRKTASLKEAVLLVTHLAGVEGFEPPNAWTKTMCLTTWPHPIAPHDIVAYLCPLG